MAKERTGISIDKDLKREADANADLNLSGLINDLLRTYFESGGRQREVFKTRLRRKRERRDELNEELDQLEREIKSLEEVLEEQREALEPALEEGIKRVKSGSMRPLDPEQPFVRNRAEQAGVTAKEYVEELVERIDGEEWVQTSEFKSVDDKRVRFDRQAFEREGPNEAIKVVEPA